MEKRTILFIALTILVWVLYMKFVMPKPAPQQPAPPQGVSQAETPPGPSQPITGTEAAPLPKPPLPTTGEFAQPEVLTKTAVIANRYFTAHFSNQGASLACLELKDYNAPNSHENLRLIDLFKPNNPSLTLTRLNEMVDLSRVNWEMETPDNATLAFQYQLPDGLKVKKIFSTQPDAYSLKYLILLENRSNQPIKSQFIINGLQGIASENKDRLDLVGLRAFQDDKKRWYVKDETSVPALKKLKGKGEILALERSTANVFWVGLANQYFATALIPANPILMTRYEFDLVKDHLWLEREISRLQSRRNVGTIDRTALLERADTINFRLQTADISLQPGEIQTLEFTLYAGPKKEKELEQFAHWGLPKTLSYGLFGFISVILLAILKAFYGLFGNYGVAIIVLTLLIKVVLFPLSRKGQVSMYKMQKLQPKLKAIQQQYKNDKQKLGMEQLKLFREHGVSPLSGCLPMLLQIPVFFGLYMALYRNIDLRQAPFMLWINDLSLPDVLCPLPFSILGATDLHLMPILMTVSWLVQSLTQPKSPDPQARSQQKLFTFMPLLFLLMLYNVPSGLTLYWFVQTLLGIFEQILIKKAYFR